MIPQAFGTFRDNLTLTNAVCGECNQYFGDNLERIFARDSSEAYDRVRLGLKAPAELHDLFHRRLTFALAMEGEWTGLRLTLEARDGARCVTPLPQVRLSKKADAAYAYVTEQELEDADWELPPEIDHKGEIAVFAPSEEVEGKLIEGLARKGISFQHRGAAAHPKIDKDTVEVEVNAAIDPTVRRCTAKILFNYLAYTSGASFALGQSFNAIRAFIRYGEQPGYDVMRISDDPILANDFQHLRQTDGHLVTVNWTRDCNNVIAQLSLFNRITYHVSLARNFSGVWRQIRCGHLFDIELRSISALVGTSLTIPRLLV